MADKEVRLIDACKIETFLRQMRYATATHGMDYDVEIVSIILETVEHEPTIEAEPVNSWISVEEKLPENETEVLIYCPEFVCTIRLAMWIEDGFYVDKEDLIVKAAPNGYCTHWMPLPEPPKGE